jgi:hypothetical protein
VDRSIVAIHHDAAARSAAVGWKIAPRRSPSAVAGDDSFVGSRSHSQPATPAAATRIASPARLPITSNRPR